RAWKVSIIERCREILDNFKKCKSGSLPKRRSLLERPDIIKYLQYIQRHLVLVPTDKAPNNISFVCKSLYVHTLRNELSDGKHNTPTPYTTITKSKKDIITAHRTHLGKFMNNKEKLPYLYN